jgi:hypothetical protein
MVIKYIHLIYDSLKVHFVIGTIPWPNYCLKSRVRYYHLLILKIHFIILPWGCKHKSNPKKFLLEYWINSHEIYPLLVLLVIKSHVLQEIVQSKIDWFKENFQIRYYVFGFLKWNICVTILSSYTTHKSFFTKYNFLWDCLNLHKTFYV